MPIHVEIRETPSLRLERGAERAAFRAISGGFGCLLMFAAAALWLLPGANWSADLVTVKLGLTGFFLLGGLSFLQSARTRRPAPCHAESAG